MNSDNVEAKTPKQILEDAFTCGIIFTAYDWPDYKDLKPGMLKALDKHYASKFIVLIDKVRHSHYVPDDDVATYDEEGRPIIYLEDLEKAIKELLDV